MNEFFNRANCMAEMTRTSAIAGDSAGDPSGQGRQMVIRTVITAAILT